MNNSN